MAEIKYADKVQKNCQKPKTSTPNPAIVLLNRMAEYELRELEELIEERKKNL